MARAVHRRLPRDAVRTPQHTTTAAAIAAPKHAARSPSHSLGHLLVAPAATLVIYAFTMPLSISGGDSGELAACACSGAVAHPPGFPSFTLLYRSVATLLRGVVAPALAFNALSTAISAGAVGILQLAILQFTGDEFAAAHGALSFALSATVWTNATQTEVFPLNNLLVAVLMWLTPWALAPRHSDDLMATLVCAFISGLALTNQHTAILYIAPVAVVLLWYRPHLLRWRSLLFHSCALAAGLLPYVFLVYASSQHRLRSWGDLTTWAGFKQHVLREEFGTFQLQVPSNTGEEAVFGFLSSFAKSSKLKSSCFALSLSYGLYIFVFTVLNRIKLTPLDQSVQERFYPQPFMIFWLFASAGWAQLHQRMKSSAASPTRISMILFLLLQVAVNQRCANHHNHSDVIDRFGRTNLDSIPDNSIVLVQGDIAYNAMTYLQACENLRSDVDFLHVALWATSWYVPNFMQSRGFPHIVFPGLFAHETGQGGFKVTDFIAANIPARPILLCFSSTSDYRNFIHLLKPDFVTWPHGLCRRIASSKDRPEDLVALYWENREMLWRTDLHRRFGRKIHGEETWEYMIFHLLWSSHENLFRAAATMARSRKQLLPIAQRLARDMNVLGTPVYLLQKSTRDLVQEVFAS